MSVINSQPLIGASGQGGAYNLTRSLRFRSSASAYLSRTPSSAGNRRTATFSFWIKRGSVATDQAVYSLGAYPTNLFEVIFLSDNTLLIHNTPNSTTRDLVLTTTQVFRDPSAWYHIVVAIDTTQATSSNRAKLYINGSQVTAFSTATYPNQNTDLNLGLSTANQIGRRADGNYYQDAYLAEFHHIDGQSLDASSFGETDTATGVWKPKKYTGTYGTNGFYLKFDNLTSTSTLGNDSSGNSNTWTVNNISLTSGSTYDSMKDVPTLTDADTANYAVLNPIQSAGNGYTLSNGNLNWSWTGGPGSFWQRATLSVSSGKWYWEVTPTAVDAGPNLYIGIQTPDTTSSSGTSENIGNGYAYYSLGTKLTGTTVSSYGASWTNNDVIGVALDMDAGTLTFYKNNASQGTAFSGITGSMSPVIMSFTGGTRTTSGFVNFGQRPFTYTPPSGFKALNTFNLPTPTIGATASTQANDYFDINTWTGNGSTQSIVNSGAMQPDLVWYKSRSNSGYDHYLIDSVRGTNKWLGSSSTSAELTLTNSLTSFNSDGFTLGSEAGGNQNTLTYVGWQWKANGAGSTNTAGSQTSTVSVNTSTGFSIATFTCTGVNVNGTVGHGLGVAPNMIITKSRGSGSNWVVYHSSVSTDVNKFLRLNDTSALTTLSNVWGDALPTSTVFGIRGDVTLAASATAVAYCFAEVAGYSKFGSYTGNGSTDGTFVYTGFRPRYLMVKRTDTTSVWSIWDTARNTINAAGSNLWTDSSEAETTSTAYDVDFLSNGFKLRNSHAARNASGGTYIFAAFAETPFKYSLGR